MFERRLFLGFQIDSAYQTALLAVNKALLGHFINDNGEYLSELVYENQRYLGRFLDSPIEVNSLEFSQEHIISLLKRLIPNYAYESSTLWLLPVVDLNEED
jgi:hypothetical protein